MERQKFLGPKIAVEKPCIYLTKIEFISYHSTGKFVGIMSETSAVEMLELDLYLLRENWINLKTMIQAFGFDIVCKPAVVKDIPEIMEDAIKTYQVDTSDLNTFTPDANASVRLLPPMPKASNVEADSFESLAAQTFNSR